MIRAFQWDLARQTERLGWLIAQLPRYAAWGYTEVYLHLEDAVEYPSLPDVARKGAYRYRELERLVKAAGKAGIGVVPIVNLLGHTQYLIKVPELRELNERVDAAGKPLEKGQICPLHPRTLEVAERLLRDMAPFCTAGKVHVGLDESFALGLHPRSRKEIREVGLAGHFGRYVRRLHEVVARVGGGRLQMGMWADMLALLPGAVKWLPRGLAAYDWYYYPFRRLPAMELYNFREYDLAGKLKERGVDYWGCPMSGGFRFEPMPTFGDRLENARSWWRRCRVVGAKGMLVTSWEETRVSAPVVQAVDAAVAGLWLEGGRLTLAKGFQRAFGVTAGIARRMERVAKGCDAYPYAGYYRWELDEDPTYAARGGVREAEKENRFFARLAREVGKRGMPEAFAASVRYRAFLAERDAHLARAYAGRGDAAGAGQTIFASSRPAGEMAAGEPVLAATGAFETGAYRRNLARGIASARGMWRASRDGESPVVRRLKAGLVRARGLERGRCQAAAGQPDTSAAFRFVVWNFEPAVQQVVVEARGQDGAWRVLRGRFTMEFTAEGARRRMGIKRPYAVPLPAPRPQALRLSVRGIGQVRVQVPGRKGWILLGKPAPKRGFPKLDLSRAQGATLTLALDRPPKPANL